MLVAVVFAWLALPAGARADDCGAIGGSLTAGECRLDTDYKDVVDGRGGFQLDETLHVTESGSYGAGKDGLDLSITGDLVIDAGGTITGVGRNNGFGSVRISATGSALLGGSDTKDGGAALIAPHRASCTTVDAPVLQLQVGGQVSQGKNSTAGTAGVCPSGPISITAPGGVAIDGLVTSETDYSNNSYGKAASGTINVSGCPVTVGDNATISADETATLNAGRIHIEGCDVAVRGFVTSQASSARSLDTGDCNTLRPGSPADAEGCIEIWSGKDILIDRSAGHRGQLRSGALKWTTTHDEFVGSSWISLVARNDVRIEGDRGYVTPTSSFTVGAGSSSGGNRAIDIRALNGDITARGDAIGAKSHGAAVALEAANDVDLDSAILMSAEAVDAQVAPGGTITARAYRGVLNWRNNQDWSNSLGIVWPATATTPAEQRGSVTLRACGAVDTEGTDFPATPAIYFPTSERLTPVTASGICGGQPAAQPWVTLPACASCASSQPEPPQPQDQTPAPVPAAAAPPSGASPAAASPAPSKKATKPRCKRRSGKGKSKGKSKACKHTKKHKKHKKQKHSKTHGRSAR